MPPRLHTEIQTPTLLRELLSYSTDFASLGSLVLTSRSFHAVFLAHRIFVLRTVAENSFGPLGEEFFDEESSPDTTTSYVIKFLSQTRSTVEALEPVVFRLLVEEGVTGCPSASESVRIRRAAYRFAKFCSLSSEYQQSQFLSRLATIQAFQLAHFVEGLKKMVGILDTEQESGLDEGRISRLVSTGPANIWRLWNSRPTDDSELEEFRRMMDDAAGQGPDEGPFDEAFHHFELVRNISAFDAIRTRPLLDVGNQQTEEALSALETLMQPPPPPPKPTRPLFRSLRLPPCDHNNHKSLSFLPDHLNSLPVFSCLHYSSYVLNGEPRVMPLNRQQLAALSNRL
ncbi:hypothetical protein FB45DRAFT_894226 [Roridomyces roridus]|uniref:Uncharacterized protein n=1 Tax=Roridomyces roridus TaxID=1738132 RepID=A0AAD7CG01_9AGAR|nr:hypothetical protein FB45DRAFT_894226 [Roridomyces roridus]